MKEISETYAIDAFFELAMSKEAKNEVFCTTDNQRRVFKRMVEDNEFDYQKNGKIFTVKKLINNNKQ